MDKNIKRVWGSNENAEDILERIKKYMDEAMKGEMELEGKYKKLVLIVDKKMYNLFFKWKRNKHIAYFFEELLEAYFGMMFLRNNVYNNVYIKNLMEAIRHNEDMLTSEKDEERINAIKENIKSLRQKVLDEFWFWLDELYNVCRILKK